MAKDIEPKLKLISEYLKLGRDEKFVIPEYQRGYSWDIVRCDKLWQDIEDFIESGPEDPYFFGTIISDCSTSDEFRLIDGQQRTTTFLLLLKAILVRLQEILANFSSDEETEVLEEGLKNNRKRIIELLYKADDEKIVSIRRDWNAARGISIVENHSINEQYKNEITLILESKTYNEAEQSVFKIPKRQKDNKYTNFFRNFKFFYEKLQNYSEAKLNTFAKTFLNKCQIIEIRSWQVEQAITMFNSLNSTGMPLSDADIISAQLYSNAGTDKTAFNEQWERINKLAEELSSRKIINIDSVLQEYMYIRRAKDREYMRGDSADVTTPGLRNYYLHIKKELLREPATLCDSFEKIAILWDTVKDYPCVKLMLKFNENTKLYFASYFFKYEREELTEEKVMPIAEILIKFFALLELVDIGYSSSLFKTFLFKENVRLVDENCDIEEIKIDFQRHINNNWQKESIESAIIDYNKNILVFLNEYLYAKEKGLKFEFNDNVNIEHIMPASGRNIDTIRLDAGIQTKEEFANIVNKLGNKILLEDVINQSISNEWFRSKKQNSIDQKSGYKDSNYNIAKSLTEYPKDIWTKDDIDIATKKAAKRILDFIFA